MGWYIDPTISDELIDIHKNSKIKSPGSSGSTVNKNVKDSTDVIINKDTLPKIYIDALFRCLNLYTDKYNFSKSINISLLEDIQLQHYQPGGGFKVWHSERGSLTWPVVTRHLVFMTYLNDVSNGGTEFLYQDIKTNSEKGLTLIWPADWTHTHRGEISYTQEKYISTGWFNIIKPGYQQYLKK